MKIFLLLIAITCCLSGCSDSLTKHLNNNIAEIREFVLLGNNEILSTTLMCGYRECEYKMDGHATELVPFGIITVVFVEEVDFVNTLHYVLYVGTSKFEGELIKNPYDDSFVADIGQTVDRNENISIDIKNNEERVSLKFSSVDSDWGVDGKDCLDIFKKYYKSELSSLISEDKFKGEVYIKIINDYDKYDSDFYYYVNCISTDGKFAAILINPKTGEILSSQSNFSVNNI